MPVVRPVLLNVVIFAATAPTWLKFTLFVERSILKPVSLLEVSVQVTLIAVGDVTVAAVPVGAVGTGDTSVVALATFEYAEFPPVL